jgi:hypothetical protein
MTTKSDRPVTRETSAFTRDRGLRPVLVTIEHGLLVLRAKGLRTRETVDIGWLYAHAVKSRVMQERFEKRQAKKARRA